MNDLAVAGKLTPEQERACELAAEGKTVKQIAKALGTSKSTVNRWQRLPVFAEAFTAARELADDNDVDALSDVLDAEKFPDVPRARLWSDNVKWRASKRSRAKYGDKIDIDVHQTIDIVGALAEARARILRPMCDPAPIEDAEYTVESNVCDARPSDKQSVSRLPAIEDQPQPNVFS